LSSRFPLHLWGVIGVGSVVGLATALFTDGEPYDMESFRLVSGALHDDPLTVYAEYGQAGRIRWPYPPGFFPWVYLSGTVSGHVDLSFEFLIRLPSIAAVAALAWLVQDFLGRRRAGAGTRLAAAALVSLGPSFLVTCGYHGQIDAVAILPGVLAISYWERSTTESRAVTAGLLIGMGGALKTVPLLLVLALLPSVRSRREALILVAAAATPMLLAFAPYTLAGTLPSSQLLSYRGLAGVGGLSLAVQPDFAVAALGVRPVARTDVAQAVADHGNLVLYVGLVAVAAVGWIWRPRPLQMAVLLWLAVYAFGANFFFQYALWGLPFFLMAGYVRQVLVVQVALLPPALAFYGRPWESELVAAGYAGLMLLVLAASLAGFAIVVRRLVSGRAPARSP
jgi:Glycosyltransferase family 87